VKKEGFKIFVISCFVDLSEKFGISGGVRTFGFYSTFKEADQAVCENRCDLSECTYSYAIIEEVFEGIHPYVENRWIYKFNDSIQIFEPIEEPEEIKHYSNFSMG
jgi:hypothetical protein